MFLVWALCRNTGVRVGHDITRQSNVDANSSVQNGIGLLVSCFNESCLLWLQHKKICEFPSYEFYKGRLTSESQHFCLLEEFWPRGPHWPIAFCDIVGKEEGASSHHKTHQESKCNKIEADKIVIYCQCVTMVTNLIYLQVDIIVALRMAKRSNRKEPKIAVLTPYKAQKRLVEDLVTDRKLKVTVSTINESQGSEHNKICVVPFNWYWFCLLGSEFDFVIFSAVRSMPRHTIRNRAAVQPDRAWIREHLGFITDRHQICVGITRAKHGLVIVGEYTCDICVLTDMSNDCNGLGNAMLLSYDQTWERLVYYYEYYGCMVGASTFPPRPQQA